MDEFVDFFIKFGAIFFSQIWRLFKVVFEVFQLKFMLLSF